jgi:hypothetical protein
MKAQRGSIYIYIYIYIYRSTLSLTPALNWGSGWLTPRPGRSDVGKETRYPLYRRLGGPQGLSGRARKICPPTGFDLPALPARRAVHKVSCIVRDLKWTMTCNITQGCLWKVNVCVGHQEKVSIYGTWTNMLWSSFPTIIGRARRFAKSGYKIRHGCPSAWNTKAPTARIFMKFSIFAFSKIYINSSIFFSIWQE